MKLPVTGQFDGQADHQTPKNYDRHAFRKYLEWDIFAPGFARAWCDDCGHDYFVAVSCKRRGVCSSRNTQRMVKGAHWATRKRVLSGVGSRCFAVFGPLTTWNANYRKNSALAQYLYALTAI